MSDCIFCDIVNGIAEASVVYEDELTLAFMDVHQLTDGHVLIIPKMHYETIDQLPLAMAGPLFTTAAVIARAVEQAFGPDGINIWQSNGAAAGQEVPHVHLHVFPRQHGDGFGAFTYSSLPRNTARARLNDLAQQIQDELVNSIH